MTKFSFILLSGEKDSFLRMLQELGVVDIQRSDKAFDPVSAEMWQKMEALKAEIAGLENGRDATLTELEAKLAALCKKRSDIAPWGCYDRKALAQFEIHFYCVSNKRFDPQWENDYALQVIGQTKSETYFVIAGGNEGFPVAEIPAPDADLAEMDALVAACESEIGAHKAVLESRKAEIPALQASLDEISSDFMVYMAAAAGEGVADDMLTVFEGFAPTENAQAVSEAVEKAGILYLREEAKVEDNPPISLKNNKFVRMFEVLTDMYGRPVYDGFDPTPYISIFFMLFFAMCMGDAGYGLVLVALGLGLKKVKGFASLSPLVTTLGVATVAVGFLFHTFFSIDISQWQFIQDSGISKAMVPSKIAGYDGTMVVAIVVGIIHLCLAMVVKTVYATKNKGFLGSLGTWGWTLFLVGSVVVLAVAMALHLDSAFVKWGIIGLGSVSAIGIFLLNDIHRNPLINVGAGLWETYNTATGVLGDVLSYLRLYALGLAGGMLGYAFNTLATMALGDGGLGWIPFILIALIGHVLNVAMAVLGAFVHPLRLNFLEFFKNSDYDGSGRNFNPLKK